MSNHNPLTQAKVEIKDVIISKCNENGEEKITQIEIRAIPVSEIPFGKDGESDDNTFARWTPAGEIKLTITNPNLFGKFFAGQKFYVDFTEAVE